MHELTTKRELLVHLSYWLPKMDVISFFNNILSHSLIDDYPPLVLYLRCFYNLFLMIVSHFFVLDLLYLLFLGIFVYIEVRFHRRAQSTSARVAAFRKSVITGKA